MQAGYVPCLTGGEILGYLISSVTTVHLGVVCTQFHFSPTSYPRATPAPHTYHCHHDEGSARGEPGAWRLAGLPVGEGITTTPYATYKIHRKFLRKDSAFPEAEATRNQHNSSHRKYILHKALLWVLRH